MSTSKETKTFIIVAIIILVVGVLFFLFQKNIALLLKSKTANNANPNNTTSAGALSNLSALGTFASQTGFTSSAPDNSTTDLTQPNSGQPVLPFSNTFNDLSNGNMLNFIMNDVGF